MTGGSVFSLVYYDYGNYCFKGINIHRYTGKCHHTIINKVITNESVEMFHKVLHTAKQKLLDLKINKNVSLETYRKDSELGKSGAKWS